MKTLVLCLVLICSIVHGVDLKDICDDDWVPYEDEKCVRLFEILSERNQAEEFCNQFDATLVTIKTSAEQNFFVKLVSNLSSPRNIWIGADRVPESETQFVWNDGTELRRFTKWAEGRPTANVLRPCVQMQSDLLSFADLDWADTACTSGNFFICQKEPKWPVEYLQRAILRTRRIMEDHVKSLADNSIPIGFVYVQLQGQPAPSSLWESPLIEWTEITSQYAGLFFRAEGGTSAAFGTIQAESSPRLNRVEHASMTGSGLAVSTITANNVLSPSISTGAARGTAATHWGLMFRVSSNEVRPRNTAMRIWIRTK